ncbi:uncharacterized protein [Rutidosis leptorrhynchoides]|uniref:uncharacterized protein n=1 Tax=Rutidosis leptorrhynchoides TaxID=125765 RepID=UPI003A98E05D
MGVVETKPVCPWTLLASQGKNHDTYIVKTLDEEHSCQPKRKLRQCSSTFISKQIGDILVADPDLKASAIQEIITTKYELGVKKMTAYRAKSKAKKVIIGDYRKQYLRLRDYCLELQKRNPNTTTKIEVYPEPNPSSDTRVFKRVYICLGPLKEGFKACKREILGLDGCFLKGPYPGQLLTDVGVDPNNGIYPLAYAVVEAETSESWRWFLHCLGDDLDLDSNCNFTFISDRQKGLMPAMARVYPHAEHRFCMRHIYENMTGTYKGAVIKDLVWKSATRTTSEEFDEAMEELKREDAGAHKYLMDIGPKHWSRSHFSGRAQCDMLLNNVCETSNSKLLDGRDKPIITCLEYVRQYLMRRIVTVQKVIAKSDGPLTPTVSKIFERVKRSANRYNATWNGGDRFQVMDAYLDKQAVDLRTKTCTCRRWELTGMPCKHAVACIWDMSLNSVEVGDPEDWVNPVYKLDTWRQVYSFKVEPITRSVSWPKSECPTTLLPPHHKKQPGRPKKKRTKSANEVQEPSVKRKRNKSAIDKEQPMVSKGKLSRAGTSKTCKKCGKQGHNITTCGKPRKGKQSVGTQGGTQGDGTQSGGSQLID